MSEREKIKENFSIALFAALMSVGAFIKIPIGLVPISLTSFFVILSALILGPYRATLSVFIYLIAGIAGLPVFSGGSGPVVFAGPTGGFLIGYIPAVFVSGIISNKKILSNKLPIADAFAVIFGTIIIYAFGVSLVKMEIKHRLGGCFFCRHASFLTWRHT